MGRNAAASRRIAVAKIGIGELFRQPACGLYRVRHLRVGLDAQQRVQLGGVTAIAIGHDVHARRRERRQHDAAG